MFYNFSGNLIYGLLLAAILIVIIDRPILGLFNIKKYAELATYQFDIKAVREVSNEEMDAKHLLLENNNNIERMKTGATLW